MLQKVIQWVIFGVVLGIIPLAAAILMKATRGQSIELAELLSNGELLLITAGIVGGGIGELLGGGRRRPSLELISGGACILILLVSSLYFADVAAAHSSMAKVDLQMIERSSLWLFGGGVFSSFTCVILSEL